MEVLLLEDVNMLDEKRFAGVCEVLSTMNHGKRPHTREADCFGPVNLIAFGDFRQEISLLLPFDCTNLHHAHSTLGDHG